MASPEQPTPEELNPHPEAPRYWGPHDLSEEALLQISALDQALQKAKPVSTVPALRRTPPQQNPGYGASPSY